MVSSYSGLRLRPALQHMIFVSTWRNTLPAAKTVLSGCRAGHGGDLREICAPPHALKSASSLLPGHITC